MALLQNIILRDTLANRPAAGTAGRLFFDTTNSILYRDNGSSWDSVEGASSSGAPTSAKYLTTAADGTLSAEVVIPGLAGSPDRSGISGGGTSREFESGDTAPSWSPSSAETTDVGTTFPSHLYVLQTTSTERFATYSWSPAGDFDVRCKLSVASPTGAAVSFGLHIGDTTNANRLLLVFDTTSGGGIAAYTYAGGTYTQRGSTVTYPELSGYLRITRTGTTIDFMRSHNGLVYHRIASQSFTFTPTALGFRASAGSYIAAAVDWLRTDV